MRPTFRFLTLVSVLVLVVSSSAVAPAGAQQAGGPVPTGEHVFSFGNIPADFAGRVASNGGRVVRTHPAIGVAVASGLSDTGAAVVAAGGQVAADVELQWIPTLEQMQGSVQSTGELRGNGHDPTTAAFFPFQWDMQIIDADDAWNAGYSGNSNVVVAVLDSGIDPYHQDLAGLVDFGTSIAFVPSVVGSPDWVDDRFHGTHVAGSIVTNGIGTSGVAPHTRLMAVKVLNVNGGGSFANITAGIMHAADNGADIINMSLGVPGGIPKNLPGAGPLMAAINRAVNYANRAGVLVISAAGNDGLDMQHSGNVAFTPCENGAGICVSATGPTDALAGYSNFGTSAVDVAGPGGDIDVTGNPFTGMVISPCSSFSVFFNCAGGISYLFAEGTSMATPHAAGVAALIDAQSNGGLRSGQLKTRLQQSADDIGKKGADAATGKGRVNACTAVGCR